MLAFTAAAGQEADDGLFTLYTGIDKINHAKKQKIETVLKEVRNEVFKKTGGKQRPDEYTELMSNVYLAGFDGSAAPAVAKKPA